MSKVYVSWKRTTNLAEWGRRGVDDVIHRVTAVGSRDITKGQAFIEANVLKELQADVKAYSSYEELVAASVS